ncbi:MAG: methyltransferase domain-containing protein [Marinilabiliales bacterium]|nr:methyltransferase domain-containing protein [Marinilabiliales bacterium]
MDYSSINLRYSELAKSDCCLSCGGAIHYAEVHPGEVCVDLGSGRGTDVLRMAEQAGSEGYVYGIDISSGMLETARKNAEKFGVQNVQFLHSDLEKIELGEGVADLVISNCTINHATNKLAVWQEIHRILKPGGKFVVSDIFATSEIPAQYKNDPVAVAECWAGAVTREEYMATLSRAGFGEVVVLEESKPYSKGQAEVCSFTVAGKKGAQKKCSCNA